MKLNPQLDLSLERIVDVTPELIWKAWTTPELIKKWFTPAPWKTIDCEIDLRPGGAFRTVMQSPEGQEFPCTSCYLELVENRRIVWTSALLPGFRPAPEGEDRNELTFTAAILLEPHHKGTKYTALAMHKNEAGCQEHRKMGFEVGWGLALDQLVALVKTL